jgi:hypothetical protein
MTTFGGGTVTWISGVRQAAFSGAVGGHFGTEGSSHASPGAQTVPGARPGCSRTSSVTLGAHRPSAAAPSTVHGAVPEAACRHPHAERTTITTRTGGRMSNLANTDTDRVTRAGARISSIDIGRKIGIN